MAYNYDNPKLGDIVYSAFEAKTPGRIVRIDLVPRDVIEKKYWNMPSNFTPEQKDADWERLRHVQATITVQTVKGTFEDVAVNLKDFKELVDQTQKKADNHSARLKAIQEMS